MRLLLVLLCLTFLTACHNTSSMKSLDEYVMLHDNSSKVWLIDKQFENDKDFSPIQFKHKEIIVFHESRNAYIHQLSDLGEKPGKKMLFELNSSNNELILRNEKLNLVFEIQLLNQNKLILKTKHRNVPQKLILVPFPEY
ncbi:MAG TPA: hypothetical protein PLI97_02495 [Fluviicola sp.]|nr:hypothetical protein [Fluviicola sp.]